MSAVEREDNLKYSLRSLTALDLSVPSSKGALAEARDCVQLLCNRLFALPREQTDDGQIVGVLPTDEKLDELQLPREKPLPKERAKTRWQKFMEQKGMTKQKRSRMVYDEASGKYLPRWGKDSIKKVEDKRENWVHEFKSGDNIYDNPDLRKRAEKRLQIAKQKTRELRNKVEASGGNWRATMAVLDRPSTDRKRGKENLEAAVSRAQASTASRGKFDRRVAHEKVAPIDVHKKMRATKKKLPGSMAEEKKAYEKTLLHLDTHGPLKTDRKVQKKVPKTTKRKNKGSKSAKRKAKKE